MHACSNKFNKDIQNWMSEIVYITLSMNKINLNKPLILFYFIKKKFCSFYIKIKEKEFVQKFSFT